MKNEKWFGLSIDEIEKKLKTNAATGLSRKAARSRAQKNEGSIFLLPSQSPYKILGDIFADFALILLLFAALVSLFFGELRNGLVVLALAFGNLIVIFILAYRSKRTMESMLSLFCPTVRVVRGGRLYCVDFRSVAVGDVILLEAGDVICCDARLVTSDGLCVRMRLDRENYQSLKKTAEGHVNPNEQRASEMVNMVHGGSVVEAGSARAIVTAQGRYTYLGAMTGGIELPFSDELPSVLKQLRKFSKKANIILLSAVIPLSIFSLLMSYFHGGTVLLSAAFLTALGLVATTASCFTLELCKVFYVNRIRKLATKSRTSAIRSIETASALAETDYLFAVDGSLLTDGKLHFSEALCAEGVVQKLGASHPTVKYFSEMVSLYRTASTRSLSTSVSGSNDFLGGIGEFIRFAKVDEAALAIRCKCLSYGAGNLLDSPEQVCISDLDRRVWLHVSRSSDLLMSCEYAMIRGEMSPLNEEGKQALLSAWKAAIASHKIPLIFTVCSDISFSNPCFLGMMFLKEGVDESWETNKKLLQKLGCRVILFSPTNPLAPKIPPEFLESGFISKGMFLKHNKPLSYRLGKIGLYTEFEKEDIMELIKEIRSRGKRVLVSGMSEEAAQIASVADGFVSCSPIRSYTSGRLDEEIQALETSGDGNGASSFQAIKGKADILVARPSKRDGGLFSLSQAMLNVKTLTTNLSDFLRYLLWTQLLRMVVLSVPLLFGQWILDARHLLFCSVILDLFAFLSFLGAKDSKAGAGQPNYLNIRKMRDIAVIDQRMLIATIVSSLSVLVFPWILDLIGLLGRFLYQREFLFVTMIFLHCSMLWFVRFDGKQGKIGRMLKDIPFILEILTVMIFLVLAFSWESFGVLFSLEKNPLPYFILSLVPSVLFLLIAHFWHPQRKQKGSK